MPRILVIDDRKDNLLSVKAILKSYEPDYEIISAQSGHEGIELAILEKPDTILLDVQMPKMDGYAVCRVLRSNKTTQHIPIIFLTAKRTTSEDRIKGLEMGGDAYPTKPIDSAELIANLHVMLRIKKAEDANLRQYENIVSSSSDMMALLDLHYTYLVVNEQYAKAFKMTPSQMVGMTAIDIFGEDNYETTILPHAEKCMNGEAVLYDTSFDFPGLGRQEIEINYSPYYRENGQIAGFVVNGRNITKRKHTQEALRNSEERYRTLVGTAPIGIISIDLQGNILSVNPKILEILGSPSAQATMKINMFEFKPLKQSGVSAAFQSALKSGESVVEDVEYTSNWGKSTFLHYHITPIFGDLGKVEGAQAIVEDITERKQAETKLMESEEKYRLLHENAALGIGYYTPEGVVISYNLIAAKDMGGVPEDFKGKSIFDLFPKDVANFYFDRIQKAVKADEITVYEDFVQLPAQDKWFLSTYTKIEDSKNKILGIQIISQDISEQKRNEESLLEERKQAQQYLDMAGVMFVVLDKNGSITLINQKGCHILGYSETEILNKNWFDLFIVDENREEIKGIFKQLLAGEIDFVEYYENAIVTKTGEQRIIAFRNSFIKDKESNITGILSSGEDITERKRAEMALVKARENAELSKHYLDNIINHIGDPVFVKNEQGKRILVNDAFCKLYNLKKEKIIGKTLSEEVPSYENENYLKVDRQVFSDGISNVTEEPLTIRDGQTKNVLTTKSRFIDHNGNKFLVGVVHDITRRRMAELKVEQALSEAKHANEVKDQFMANISHEIRTPLNSILGFSDLIKQRFGGLLSEKDQELFGYINNSSTRLMSTVDSILNISQLKAGVIKVHPIEIDLSLMTAQVVKQIELQALDKKLDLIFKVPKKPKLIFADEYCIHQSILTLTENAIKYTIKGTVEIKLGHRDDQLTLSITDTGIGISDEYQKRIFEPYSQESEGFTKNYQGVGLGLALTKRYLGLNDVELELVSQKNVGSTFTLIFPRYERGA